MVSLDLSDIQGLVHRHYGYPFSRHLLFSFPGPTAGRRFLAGLTPKVTDAARDLAPRPAWLLNLSLSFPGLAALRVSRQILDGFPRDFRDGPDPVSQGDYGESAPVHWWKGKFATDQIHLAVHLYARSRSALERVTHDVRGAAAGCRELIPTQAGQPIETAPLGSQKGEIHFGYRDGISQPDVKWGDAAGLPGELDFRHFLLGYSSDDIPSSPFQGHARQFARNGSYAVFRWIYQDVARFNRFLEAEGPALAPHLAFEDAQELLAAKLIGRWRDGTPLALSPGTPDAGQSANNSFGYADDPTGLRCPLSAHVRVTNPRDQPLGFAEQIDGGVPRLLRRGAPFGPKLEGTVDDGIERGLVGMFLCASIVRQAYKLMVWMQKNDFSPAFPGVRAQDPMANRAVPGASSVFALPDGHEAKSVKLQDFVRTMGSANFLLPSIATLRALAENREAH